MYSHIITSNNTMMLNDYNYLFLEENWFMTDDLSEKIKQNGLESISWNDSGLLFDPERFIMLFPGF